MQAHFTSLLAIIDSIVQLGSGRPERVVAMLLMRFGQMRHHVRQNSPDVPVIDRVAHVPPLPFSPKDTSRAQQPEVVRREGLRHREDVAELADAALPVHAREHEAEAVGFAEQPEDLRQPGDIVRR